MVPEEKLLVVVFDTEVKAREALRALEGLFDASVIRLNAGAIVTKTPDGAITVSEPYRPSPEGTLGGSAVGLLIGMLAGTIGVAVGFAIGVLAGGLSDVFYLKVGEDFLAEVERTLAPGKSAVVAQIYEEHTEPVDERMAELGGVVLRRPLGDVADTEYQKVLHTIERRLSRAR